MIGVIIPVYAANADIMRVASDSLRAHLSDLPAWARLIVVRNGGQALPWPAQADVCLDLPVNIGFTGAVNVGIRTAQALNCDHFIVSSADVFPPDGWAQGMMADGLVSALEADSDAHCGHDGPCPFWGGMFSFSQALLDDVGYLPTAYSRIGDAAFAAKAATRGWPVTRAPVTVEHRHPHAANKVADPRGGVMAREKTMLHHEYGRDICALLLEVNAMSPFERWRRTRAWRTQDAT